MSSEDNFDENDLDLLQDDLVKGNNESRRVIWKNSSFKEPPEAYPSDAVRRRHASRSSASHAFGRIRVMIRCRPLLSSEFSHTMERLQIIGDSIVIRHPVSGDGKRFAFDRVMPPESEQHDVFAEVHPLIEHVLNGFHATVFAYGQTGSGKTYTMDGLTYHITKHGSSSVPIPDPNTPVEHHGVLLRAIQMMFDRAAARKEEMTDKDTGEPKEGCPSFEFKCSFLQIYNEKITDLLQPTLVEKGGTKQSTLERGDGGLKLRWMKGDVFRVQNLFLCECDSPGKMRDAFFKGVKEKIVASHLMNQQSSRSHTIFTIYVIRRDAKNNDILSRSEFSLVDLAGSEKLKSVAVDSRSRIAKESIEINTSLLALGKVIIALANAKGKKGPSVHVPYRESKLTRLLKHAIGGNSLTTMIACISPSDTYIDESVSTMLYAGRAKNIENAPKVNEDPNYAIIRQLREEIRQLKEELQYYRVLAASGIEKTEQNAKANRRASDTASGALVTSDMEHPATVQEKNELADSLLSACEMMKQIITVNGQLREAYDVLKNDRESASTREMHLNAENLALRERIEMLESIVMNDEFMNSTKMSPGEGTEASERSDGEEESAEDAEEEAEVYKRESPSPPSPPSPSATANYISVGQKSSVQRHSTSATPSTLDEISTLPPFNAGAYRAPILKQARVTQLMPNTPTGYEDDLDLQPEYTHETPLPNDHSSSVEKKVRMHQKPMNSSPEGGSSSAQRSTVASQPSQRNAALQRKSATTRSAERIYKKKRSRSTRVPKKKFASQLAEYDQRYRQPARHPSYAEYYGRARPLGTNKSNTTIEEMDQVLKKLPNRIAEEIVPSSLKLTGNFGDLTFVGSRNDVAELQQKRMEREEKLRNLLMRNRELNMLVHSEVSAPRTNSRDTRRPGSTGHRPSSLDRRPQYQPSMESGGGPRRPISTGGIVMKQGLRCAGGGGRVGGLSSRPQVFASTYDRSQIAPTRDNRPPFTGTLPPSAVYADRGFDEYNSRLRQMLHDDERERDRASSGRRYR